MHAARLEIFAHVLPEGPFPRVVGSPGVPRHYPVATASTPPLFRDLRNSIFRDRALFFPSFFFFFSLSGDKFRRAVVVATRGSLHKQFRDRRNLFTAPGLSRYYPRISCTECLTNVHARLYHTDLSSRIPHTKNSQTR